MSLWNPFSRRLYLRIWLAVVGGMAVLTLAMGWVWQLVAEQNLQSANPPPREIVLRSAQGEVVLRGQATRQAVEPGEGLEFRIDSPTGESFYLQMPARPHRAERLGRQSRPAGPSPWSLGYWTRPPFGFVWMLALVSIAVGVGVFPIIRRLTQRLEHLQRSVKRFGDGDLSVRVPDHGQDEMAELARQFNAAANRIEALLQSHKSLLANASHELRSPLTRIRMGLELMGSGPPSEAFRTEILRNIAELDQLVEEILLASRLDAREADVGSFESVDLVGLAAEECARVDADLDAGAGTLEISGVAKLVRRALRNLLENARRYSDGPISVTVRLIGSSAELRVCDQGPGVPPHLRERIFEPFFRLPGASERAGGVGLGLALVRSIAQRHRGSVTCVDNPAGPGACFVLRLPLDQTARFSERLR